jgi:hypothetical protein
VAEDAPASLRPLLTAAEDDAWRTKSGSLRATAIILAARGRPDRSPAGLMRVAPQIDDVQRWAAVTSVDSCVDAVDAARSWLFRHGEQVTAGQLVTVSRATFALTHFAGHILVNTGALTNDKPVLPTPPSR